MPTIIILLIITLFLIVGLSVNTARATKNYNSSKSNTSSALKEADIEDVTVAGYMKLELEDAAVDNYGKVENGGGWGKEILLIEEDKMRERLAELGVTEEKVERAVQKVREAAAQETVLNLPKAGLTPTSPFYFVERWGEGVREFFTFSAEAKMKFHAEQASERIAEVKAMLEKKEVNPRGLELALERLEKNIRKNITVTLFKSDKTPGRSVSRLALELGADLENRKMALNAIFEEADERREATGEIKNLYPPTNKRQEINKTFDEADEKLKTIKKTGSQSDYFPSETREEQVTPSSEPRRAPGLKSKPTEESRKEIEAVPAQPIIPIQKEAPSAVGPAGEGTAVGSAGEGARAATDYNSSISNSYSVGKIREEIGNVLIRYGAGGAEINRVTDALEVGVDEADLTATLREINISEAGIQEVLAELERLGAKQK